MHNIHPSEGEPFWLRELLISVPGPTSFDDLLPEGCTTDNTTFQEACILKGMIADDERWFDCMYEASLHNFSKPLQGLFLSFLLFDKPPNVRYLWDAFKDDMAHEIILKTKKRDILKQYTESQHRENGHNQVKKYLQNELQSLKNKTLLYFKIPKPTNLKLKLFCESFAEEFEYDKEKNKIPYIQSITSMTEESI